MSRGELLFSDKYGVGLVVEYAAPGDPSLLVVAFMMNIPTRAEGVEVRFRIINAIDARPISVHPALAKLQALITSEHS